MSFNNIQIPSPHPEKRTEIGRGDTFARNLKYPPSIYATKKVLPWASAYQWRRGIFLYIGRSYVKFMDQAFISICSSSSVTLCLSDFRDTRAAVPPLLPYVNAHGNTVRLQLQWPIPVKQRRFSGIHSSRPCILNGCVLD